MIRLFDRICKNKVLLAFLMLFSLMAIYPNLFFLNKILPTIPKMLFRTSFMVIVFAIYLFTIIKNKKIDILFIICLFFIIFQIFSTVVNNADLTAVIYSNLMIALSCLIITDIYTNINKRLYIETVFWYLVSLNIICIIVYFCTGMVVPLLYNFYGNCNDAFRFNLPLVLISYYKFRNKKSIAFIINFVLLLQAIISGALTSFIVFLFVLIYMFFLSKKNIKILNIYSYLFFGTTSSLIFVMPKLNRYLFDRILPIIGKSKTASGRFNIYDAVINNICVDNILIGHGHYKIEMFQNILKNNGVRPYSVCHNVYLEILFKYGIVGVLFSLAIVVVCYYTIKKCKDIYLKNLSQISFAAVFIWSIPEPVLFYNFLFIFGIMIYTIGKYEFNFVTKKLEFSEYKHSKSL